MFANDFLFSLCSSIHMFFAFTCETSSPFRKYNALISYLSPCPFVKIIGHTKVYENSLNIKTVNKYLLRTNRRFLLVFDFPDERK